MKMDIGAVKAVRSASARDRLWILTETQHTRMTPGQAMKLAAALVKWAWKIKRNRKPT